MVTLIKLLFIIVCVLLILIVLLQKGRGGGLGAAFGDGAAGSAFGTRTGDVLTWITIVLTGFFLLAAVGLGPMLRPDLGKLEPPVFNPSEWPETKRDAAVIRVGISAQEGATIRYAIDEEITDNSPEYKQAKVAIKSGQTLRAIATRIGPEDSDVTEHTYVKPKPETRPRDQTTPVPETMPAPETRPAGKS